jgi:hypothetical protein
VIRRFRLPALAVCGLLAAAGAVRAASSGYRARLDALRKDAVAQRARLGLDKDRVKLYAGYPTPEVAFGSGSGAGRAAGLPVHACACKTVPVKVTGKFVAGTQFVFESDDVEVLKEAATPTQYEAQVKLRCDLTPRAIVLEIISPVSGASRTVPAIELVCAHSWILTAGGETLTLRTDWPAGASSATAQGSWKKGDATLDTSTFQVNGSVDHFSFERSPTQDEMMDQMKAMQTSMTSPAMKALDGRMAKATAQLTACGKGAPAQMAACMKAPSDELTKIGAEREALMKKAEKAVKAGCEHLEVDVQPGGVLKGKGERCAGGGSREVSGTVKAG